MKLRTLSLVAFVLLVGFSSVSKAGMHRQRRAGVALEAEQSTSQQTCINEGAQNQKRNGQAGNGQNCLRQGRGGKGQFAQAGNGQGRNRQGRNGKGRNGQGNGQGRNRQGRNGQGGNGQQRRGQGANMQACNCDGTCTNQ